MSASPELGGKCRTLRGDRGKLAYTGQNHFSVSPHACPFRRLRRHLPRQAGTAYVSYTFLYVFIYHQNIMAK